MFRSNIDLELTARFPIYLALEIAWTYTSKIAVNKPISVFRTFEDHSNIAM